uniref:Uncharacterized protein n=1 Tax=Arundo donax TaxID=35708 RepID=A0A0A8ZJ26_ARUDO
MMMLIPFHISISTTIQTNLETYLCFYLLSNYVCMT